MAVKLPSAHPECCCSCCCCSSQVLQSWPYSQISALAQGTGTHWIQFSTTYKLRGGASNFHLGAIVQGLWGTEVPSGVQRRSPGRGLGDRSQINLQTLFTDFDCGKDQNLKISHNSPPDSWRVYFTVGAKRHSEFLAPSPCLATPLY